MSDNNRRIEIQPNGPYLVRGEVRLVRRSPIISEYGEPLAWRTGAALPAEAPYLLCRCGQSANKPFCDGSHLRAGFEGSETAAPEPIARQQKLYPGNGVEMRDARKLCVHAGFCGNRLTNVWKMIEGTADTQVRAQLMAMIERCPSGALSYALAPGEEPVEPSLPAEIAPLADGPLWVTGGIRIVRSDGTVYEERNRLTLCRCGASRNKPFCDGSHAEIGFSDAPGVAGPAATSLNPGQALVDGGEAVSEPDETAAATARHASSAVAGDSTTAAPPGGEDQAGAGDDCGRYLRYMAEFIGYTPADAQTVRATKWVIDKHVSTIVTAFYDQLLRYPPTRRFFLRPDRTVDQEYLELRMRHQASFWLHAAEGHLDDSFAAYLDFAGRAHTARGADPSVYIAERYVIGMVGFVQHAISRALTRELGAGDPAFLEQAQVAWDKLTMVILEVFARAYGNEHAPETYEPLVTVDRETVAASAERAMVAQRGTAPDAPRREVWVAKETEVPDGERHLARVDGRSIGVFHQGGRWYAVRNYCLHRGGPVATGPLEGCTLTCPWHGYRYDIATGACQTDSLARLDTFPVIVRDGDVYLEVPEVIH